MYNGMIDDPDIPKGGKHHWLNFYSVKKSKLAVKQVMAAIYGFTYSWGLKIKTEYTLLHQALPFLKMLEVTLLQ